MPATDADHASGDDGDPLAPDEDRTHHEGTGANAEGDGAEGDGGVLNRLVRRSRTGATVLLVVGVALLIVALLLPSGVVPVTAALLAVVLIAIGAVLGVRAAFWSGMTNATKPLPVGTPGIVGQPKALSPTRPGAPLRRKLGATVVPIALRGGPQPGGGALLIHARADGVALSSGDDIEVWRAARTGPEALPGDGQPALSGRFVLRRDADGAVFHGTSRLTDVL